MKEKTDIEKMVKAFCVTMRESIEENRLINQKFKEFDRRMENAKTLEDIEKIREDFDKFKESQK